MKVIDYDTLITDETAITTGNFDGVHLGHKQVLHFLNTVSKKNNYKTVLITFKNHPRSIFHPEESHQLLTTFGEKLALLKESVDYILPITFDRDFSLTTANKYMQHLISNFNLKHYIAGHDHHIGVESDGSFSQLSDIARHYGFDLDVVPPLNCEQSPISSTRIKSTLMAGHIEQANRMLGYNFHISGIVIAGRKLGRQIGFPTANIQCPENKLIPSIGVYAVSVYHKGQKYGGMLNIGYNPTVVANGPLSVEVNIFDFDTDIYGETIAVEFHSKIRNEIVFNDIEKLKKQLLTDRQNTLDYLENNINSNKNN